MYENLESFKLARDENGEVPLMRTAPARGRPRLGNAMTAAERAKRYRDNKKSSVAPIKRDDQVVTLNRPAVHERDGGATQALPSYGMLESRIILLNAGNMQLSNQLREARDQLQNATDLIASLRAALKAAEIAARHKKLTVAKTKKTG